MGADEGAGEAEGEASGGEGAEGTIEGQRLEGRKGREGKRRETKDGYAQNIVKCLTTAL